VKAQDLLGRSMSWTTRSSTPREIKPLKIQSQERSVLGKDREPVARHEPDWKEHGSTHILETLQQGGLLASKAKFEAEVREDNIRGQEKTFRSDKAGCKTRKNKNGVTTIGKN